MRTLKHLLTATALAAAGFGACATPLALVDFDGSETLVDFNSAPTGSFFGAYSAMGVTLTAESGQYMFQAGGGGLLGTSGTAYNTNSASGNADVTFSFANAISRFGVNFGTAAYLGPLSAEVRAYDSANNLVEAMSFASFGNAFVGFDFASAVTTVVIDRTDATSYFTFVDDVRFEAASVPEPTSMFLLGVAALAAGAARRRKGV